MPTDQHQGKLPTTAEACGQSPADFVSQGTFLLYLALSYENS